MPCGVAGTVPVERDTRLLVGPRRVAWQVGDKVDVQVPLRAAKAKRLETEMETCGERMRCSSTGACTYCRK